MIVLLQKGVTMNSKICVPDTHKMTMSSIGIALILFLISGCTDVIVVGQKEQHFEIPQYTVRLLSRCTPLQGATSVSKWRPGVKN
jgi:hypothetical protein